MDLKTEVIAIIRIFMPQQTVREHKLRAGDTFRIGRHSTNDLAVLDNQVSRYHAVMNASATGVLLSDLASLNGTFVNKERVTTPINLESNDVVAIGDTKITIELPLTGIGEDVTDVTGTQAAALEGIIVTVLVADVCGYTYLSEHLDTQVVANMLQRWFKRTTEIVKAHGGIVDKYIGDCVMAVWRGPREEGAELARLALEAAKVINESSSALSLEPPWDALHQQFPWHCRVALNSGEALSGAVGDRGARDFTVLGDTVNVAFRLEGYASQQDHDFVLGPDTAELLKDNQNITSLGTVKLPGREKELEVFTLNT